MNVDFGEEGWIVTILMLSKNIRLVQIVMVLVCRRFALYPTPINRFMIMCGRARICVNFVRIVVAKFMYVRYIIVDIPAEHGVIKMKYETYINLMYYFVAVIILGGVVVLIFF